MTDWLLLLLAFALTAFCSGSETACSAASRIRVLGRVREGRSGARATSKLLARPELYLTTTLVGTNIGTVLASAVSARLASRLDHAWAEPAAAAVTAVLILIFAEVVPKQLAFVWRDSLVDSLVPVLKALRILFLPLVAAANVLPGILMKRKRSSRFFESREEVRSFLVAEGEEAGREAEKLLRLGSAVAGDVARPVEAFPFLSSSSKIGETREAAARSGSSYLLVFERDDAGGNLLGCARTAAVLRADPGLEIARITEGMPYFDSKTVLGKALYLLRRAGAPAGVVLGRSGQPSGLLDSDSVMDLVLGEGGEGPAPRSGTIGWRNGRAIFDSRPVADA